MPSRRYCAAAQPSSSGLNETEGDKFYISAVVVSGRGVVTNYHKTHLWWNDHGARHEPTFYKPGQQLVTFNTKGAKCGLMICYDGDFPEMTGPTPISVVRSCFG